MFNTGKFAGRTVLISGASRGIGKEIGLKLAKDGANVVIAAKTAEPHPKLPGTIYTAAEEVEKAGGKALPCIVDVRDEKSVQSCVEQAVKKFGGIDILINNASAISLTGTLDTDMKRYDLMHSINTRGTFLLSKTCIPYLKQGKNPHILNISPPLLMESQWFSNHVAYTMAKFGMSMCVLGMSEELKKDKIAVNALWPLTSIWTAAMEMLSAGEGAAGSRKPTIMSDAAYAILSKNSADYTGNFAIDEDILKEAGVTDLEQYSMVPGHPLTPDFFIPGGKYEQQFSQTKERSASRKDIDSKISQGEVQSSLAALKKIVNGDIVAKIGATFEFNLTGDKPVDLYIDLKNGNGAVGEGKFPSGASDVQMECSPDNFVKLFNGQLSPTTAFITKKLKIQGNMGKALKLEGLLKQMQKRK